MRIDPAEVLSTEFMGAINFLNEAESRYPCAISFSSGRPADRHLESKAVGHWIAQFVAHCASQLTTTPDVAWASLGQYGPTNGMIREVVASFVANDFGITVDPDAVMVTNGFQEALLIVLLGLARADGDVVLSCDPTYAGLVGAATIARMRVETLDPGVPIATALAEAVRSARRSGRSVRACYLIPDFNNPTGATLSLEARRELLAAAAHQGVPLIEDTAYRMFAYDADVPPSLAALDDNGCVLHLGSFSKVLLPGLRVGYLVASQKVGEQPFAKLLSTVKSFTSVQTSPLVQAAVAGLLLEQGLSLVAFCRKRIADYRRRRDALIAQLERHIGADDSLQGVTWSHPSGGFFLAMSLPFTFTMEDVDVCARDFGVLVCPMSLFSPRGGFRQQVRLSFSNVEEMTIEEGVRRLRRYLIHRTLAVGESPSTCK